jgi:hypothetical protein
MQALVDKKVAEHRSVVLWRAKEEQVVSAFDQIRLEMFFGSVGGFHTSAHRKQATRN